MTLNEYVARKKREILANLERGGQPGEGRYDSQVLADARVKGSPQMGATTFTPSTISLEFIYSDARSAATIFTVTLDAPERIVFLPVPEWVVENIWQGSIDGAYRFASDAERSYANLGAELSEQENAKWFGPRAPTRRE